MDNWGIDKLIKEGGVIIMDKKEELKEYRILWEKTQLGNTIVKANSKEEAINIAKDNKKDIDWADSEILIVNAFTFK